ncbi:MAG: XRE family transcriptional regulator [Bacteroidetes bacterium]|jgi:transcriptional regulator with XRE-family HTH domain|nr:MAG: XRE family transcriptional regulator [Bacteroidota bacterium]
MDLGITIKNIRKKQGLTQGEFAERIGITQTYLSQIENNLREPNLSTLKSVSKGLKTPLPVLFFLSMTEEDVQPKKRDAFKLVSPSVKSLLHEFFSV